MSWISDLSANRFNNTYFRDAHGTGFAVDMSGDLIVRGGSVAVGVSGLNFGNSNVWLSQYTAQSGSQYIGKYWDVNADNTEIGIIGGMEIENTTLGGSYSQKLHFHTHQYGSSVGRRLTIAENGNVGIGTSSPYGNWDLHIYNASSQANLAIQTGVYGWVLHTMESSNPGQHLYFLYSGNSFASWSTQAYVSLSGSGGQMNFTGQHRTFVENVLHTDASNNQGLIVCANKNTYVGMNEQIKKGNNAITQNESLPLVSLCTKSKDKSCFGVISESEDPNERSDRCGNFVTPYEKEEGDTRIYINSVGEGAIWVSNKNGPLESGDYITTSDIPGYGEKQDSEFLANYTVAKITMDCDFNPQLQPKEIILKEAAVDDSGNNIYKNVLDANGEIQWTPELDSDGNVVQEYAYNLRYLDLQGTRLTKAEYDTKLANGEQVYIAAYVGCTYHCG